MSFTRESVYFNPAKADPSYLNSFTYDSPSGVMSYLATSSDESHVPLVAVSSGMSGLCTLVSGGRKGWDDIGVKKISLTLHALEFDRVANCLGRALDFTVAECDYYNGAISVSTQPLFHAGSLSSSYLVIVYY